MNAQLAHGAGGLRFRKGYPVFKSIGWLRFAVVTCVLFLPSANFLSAQKEQREPLTAAQQDQIAEAGVDPDQRIGLYVKFVNEHAQTIESVGKRAESGRGRRLDGELQDFSALVDELTSNLDEYGDRKADIRKALKGLSEAVPRWQGILRALPKDPVAEIALSDAKEALKDLADETKKFSAEQEKYFNEHKDAKGQQREEPQ